ncbi:MAG TPA: squalene--hopene cyclase [Pirellulales bacterium]|nr:squalene--hopene cyclase [Pirellulales bacterium]
MRRAVIRTRQWLLDEQQPEGYWVGELEGDTILESEYILLLAYLGRLDSREAQQAARYIIGRQLPEGGWSIYPGGAVEISASVKAYFALKLTGHDSGAETMRRARAAILAGGGADAVNSFTRFYLALLGQISYDQCPAVPPELVLLPNWFPVNLYSVSAWSRTMLVPLSIMSACQPVTEIEPGQGIRELFLKDPADWPEPRCPGLQGGRGMLSWERFFRTVDKVWKWCQRRRVLPARRRGLRAAERWMLERFEGSDGLGAIFPPMVWSVIALRALGYDDDAPAPRYCHRQIEGLFIVQDDTLRVQPCKSPVWDTAITLRALAAAGVGGEHPTAERATEWLLDMQIHRRGDWARTVAAEPGGWCFEYANEFYPDLDDTAMVVMALAGQFDATPDEAVLERASRAIAKAERWMLAMQNRDGGWGAFDRDNDREFLCRVPFADHNAMIDPSTPDLTARVLEALGQLGRRVGNPRVDRAVAYLRRTQEADGSWFGRWGVNYIYGTWQVLTGLAAVGLPASDPLMVSGGQWLLMHQQPSGAWGESPDSYADPRLRGQGPPTASQTAWAVLGLLAAGLGDHEAAARGIRYLLARQRDDGTWDEPEFTGTGFPRVFYLRYHLYRIYFPLLALARWAAAVGQRLEPVETARLKDGMVCERHL